MTPEILEGIVQLVNGRLDRPTNQGKPLLTEQRLMVFLHWIGTNSFYHEIADQHSIHKSTVCRIVHEVSDLLFELRNDFLRWPDDPEVVAEQFYRIARIPNVFGAIDGTHVLMHPSNEDEPDFINRHQTHSFNCLVVAGADLRILYADCNNPGRLHDSNILRLSSLWRMNEVHRERPFPGAVLLGDSAYPCMDWLMTPFRGPVAGNEARFNRIHARARSVVERTFGVLKNRFYALHTGLRVTSPLLCGKVIICAMMLHNMCIDMGDDHEFPLPPAPGAIRELYIPPGPYARAGQRRRDAIVSELFEN